MAELDLDKLQRSIKACAHHPEHDCNNCEYSDDKLWCYNDELISDFDRVMELLKAQDEIIQELINVGVPHNFQREQPWLVTYMYKITAIVQKAFKLKGEE